VGARPHATTGEAASYGCFNASAPTYYSGSKEGLLVEVVRGLLLDVLATGDDAGVDAAYELFLTAISSLQRDAGAR
jgi:hypothetical protein